jgi:4-hydroxybenzoate polyprenyltransferase
VSSRPGSWLIELRPDQWTKNIIVFAALVFGKQLLDPLAVFYSCMAFAVFCAASSSVYVVNDVMDRELDRLHPEKRNRPIAAGLISVPSASIGAALLGSAALAGAAWVGPGLLFFTGCYLILNLFYSGFLKHVVLLDVIVIALGFVLRAVAGAAAIGVEISAWLVVCTFMVMLFLALGKRRAEVAAYEDAGAQRPASRSYTVELLDQLMTVVVAATIVSYCLYTLDPAVREKFQVAHLEATVPFVVYGLFRYLYLVRCTAAGENPSRLVITDRPVLTTVVLWGLVVVALIYVGSGPLA